jgi:KDO2-lipid IV(A) lauroyltransferase
VSRIILALMWLIHWLPFGALAALGNGIGVLAFWLIPERRRVTRINLRKCFPALSETER